MRRAVPAPVRSVKRTKRQKKKVSEIVGKGGSERGGGVITIKIQNSASELDVCGIVYRVCIMYCVRVIQASYQESETRGTIAPGYHTYIACKDEFRQNIRSHSWSVLSFFIINIQSVAPVAYQVILEPGIGQLHEFEPPRVLARINSWGLFLVHKVTCGKRESAS